MSSLKVPLVSIKTVEPHTNADRLEVATIEGWSCIVPKGIHAPGDRVIYIPIDSILSKEIEDYLFPEDSKIKLSKSRVRTIRLRGLLSQGIIVELSEELICTFPKLFGKALGDNVADVLGITKYEPPLSSIPGAMRGQKSKKQNPYFKEYTELENIKWYQDVFVPDEPIYVTEKLHGCLKFRTNITLADGSKRFIGDLVNNREAIDILGMNVTGDIVPTKILNWFKNGTTKDWLKIRFTQTGIRNTNPNSVITCTPEHQIYTLNRGYIAARDLMIGDELLTHTLQVQPSFIQHQVLIGKMLGDGSVSKGSVIQFGHKQEHQTYVDYTVQCLGNLAYRQKQEYISGYGTTMVRGATKACAYIGELFNDWFVQGHKEVPETIISTITPIALAFWYMDDGSLTHQCDQKERANFAVCGFNEQSIDVLISVFQKFGIQAVKYLANNYWRIRLNEAEAEKFFCLIGPYVPPVMQYKLPQKFRGGVPYIIQNESVLRRQLTVSNKVISIEPHQESQIKYDLETETHNFFANQTLVHNSSSRYGWLKVDPRNKIHEFLQNLGFLPKYEWVYGSHKRQLQDAVLIENKTIQRILRQFVDYLPRFLRKRVYRGFYEEDVYAIIAKQEKLRHKLKPGEALYGEICGAKIQGEKYSYGNPIESYSLHVFDVMKDGKYLDAFEFRKFCYQRNIPTVPEDLDIGYFNLEMLTKAASEESHFHMAGQKIKEGIVIRPIKERYDNRCGRVILKMINPEYLLDFNNQDFH